MQKLLRRNVFSSVRGWNEQRDVLHAGRSQDIQTSRLHSHQVDCLRISVVSEGPALVACRRGHGPAWAPRATSVHTAGGPGSCQFHSALS